MFNIKDLKFNYMNKISYVLMYIDDLVNLIKECLALGLISQELVIKKLERLEDGLEW